ncbi:Tex family protein [Thalassorhabdus alkalitolerans]|uniref:Tex family protein n=1 Tax=Thalassorhabdus alkalitolerans TaxID=2282697 RepID=A0ABW0YNM2_9BACI
MNAAEQQQLLLEKISEDLTISQKIINNVIQLLEEGNTVPFIARYRKEMTSGADEVRIRDIQESWNYGQQLLARKQEVTRLIEEQGKLTPELKSDIEHAEKLQMIEDLYRPFRQKRRTRATKAKEKGLQPLAEWIYSLPKEGDLHEEANKYIDTEKEVRTGEEALQGANDVIAEWIADEPSIRQELRELTYQKGKLRSYLKNKEKDEQEVYGIYYEYEESLKKVPSHRILAMNRGEKEEALKLSVVFSEDTAFSRMEKKIIKRHGSVTVSFIQSAIQDAYKRLIAPAIEREVRKELTEKAEEQAIHIFSENLKNLLLQPPMKGKVVLGVDPAYRTGCKLAVIDETGKVLAVEVVYPTPPRKQVVKSKSVINQLIDEHNIEVIVIGNGTASRETEEFIAEVITEHTRDISYLIISEAGASVYSASELGREEFPHLEVEERSAASIARRLQDPLAELVKIDPKSVGVGQYQHDVSQGKLNDSLTFVVETAVNQVGVNVNTASPSLLQYVSGLSKTVANNIVKQRDENGRFMDRKELKKIPRLGSKTYEQAIGFLRITEGKNPLDKTSIHPESYKVTEQLIREVGGTIEDVGSPALIEKVRGINASQYAKELGVGEPTLKDILDALARPNRDPRDDLPRPVLKKGIMSLEDLTKGMELQGTVRNVVDFGAFVDIGVKEDGLVHISKMSNRYVKHPMEIVSVGDVVTVWVESVDHKKGRISLTMIEAEKQTS